MASVHSMTCLADFERYAFTNLSDEIREYYIGGADEKVTLRDNIAAFQRFKILPRILRDVSERDLSTTILGHRIDFPVCLAPTAKQQILQPGLEEAAAKAAESAGIAFVLGTAGDASVEQIAEAAPNSLRFFQLYMVQERAIVEVIVHWAERSGFRAILLTVDLPVCGQRREAIANAGTSHELQAYPNFNIVDFSRYPDMTAGSFSNSSLTWNDVKWLKSITKLPIVLKGILAVADAQLAVECGVDGILVSNHGGRQLDTVPATIDVLSDVVKAVAGRCEVYLDGGVRLGTDVLKTLALGARAVFIGRPVIYGLAYDGENGVRQVLKILREEFSTAMALSGCRDVGEITKDLIRHQSYFSSRL